MKKKIAISLALLLIFPLSSQALASTFNVNTFDDPAPQSAPNGCNSGGRCSLREAVIQANEHAGPDTIVLQAGTYKLSIPKADPPETDSNPQDPKSGDLDVISTQNGQNNTAVSGGLTLKGAGMADTIIQAEPGLQDRVISILHNNQAPFYEISGLTIQNGQTDSSGGGLYVSTGSGFNFLLKNVKFENNKSVSSGGGASFGFGGTGKLTSENAVFHKNTSENFGGGIYFSGSDTILEMTGGEVSENQGKGYGGGIYAGGGSGSVDPNFIMHTFRGITVRGNIIGKSDDSANGKGGGISCGASKGCAILDGSLIENNQSNSDGGGVIIGSGGHSHIERSTIRNNVAANGGKGGGALLGGSQGSVYGSTFSGNQTDGNGGGLYVDVGGGNGVVYSTFSGNQAKGQGGGIAFTAGHLIYKHLSIVKNSASAGGGMANITNIAHSDGFLTNTLFFQNTAALVGTADCAGKIDNEQWNIYGDQNIFDPTHCYISTLGPDPNLDFIDANLQIGDLADNGGPTPTHALLAGSSAIDKGLCDESGLFPDTDQRGQTAPIGAKCDIGAVEAGTADVEVAMTGDPGSVPVGGTVTFTLTVKNGGPNDSLSARVAIPLAGMTFATSEACSADASTVNCTLENLAPGASGSADFTLNAVSAGKVTHTATLVGSEIDPNTGNNSASVDTTVTEEAASTGSGCALLRQDLPANGAWWLLALGLMGLGVRRRTEKARKVP